MSNTNYRVSPRGAVMIGLRYFGPNTIIPASAMTERQRENLLRERSIVIDGQPVPATPAVPLPPRVGVSEREFWDRTKTTDASVGDPTTSIAAQRAKAALQQIAVDREEGRVQPREAVTSVELVREQPAAPAAPSPWTHDPDGLVGQPIDELRRLIRAVDATIEVDHLDEVDCIAVLSADYVAPAPAKS